MDIYVDGVIVTTWTSSGTTSGFETVEMGVPGQVIELHGILGDREWISIIEVCIYNTISPEVAGKRPISRFSQNVALFNTARLFHSRLQFDGGSHIVLL